MEPLIVEELLTKMAKNYFLINQQYILSLYTKTAAKNKHKYCSSAAKYCHSQRHLGFLPQPTLQDHAEGSCLLVLQALAHSQSCDNGCCCQTHCFTIGLLKYLYLFSLGNSLVQRKNEQCMITIACARQAHWLTGRKSTTHRGS